ncbi:MAG TPA: efflux RND transporter permease subunit [Vicinamibacterales bacterium]|jgi:multidrug efflux pump subunit AcrB|nr:efflux RND transporter permease subunit [Vicinamibacterales bacterium]
MSRFSIRNPYFIIVICLMVMIIGVTCLVRMPVDLFPTINIPEVVVATSYNGMPPEEIETEITGKFERFFTLGSGIDHMESRSLPGVSIIKVYFQPGTNADSDVNTISNLAMADLRRLPPGTMPPIILKFDASSLPVCLVTLKGEGLSEATLRDVGQFTVRNQLAVVPGASVPQPFGGKFRQIMVYVDPDKLQSYQLSPMDVVRAVNNANLILPAGDVKIGPLDYALYSNSQFPTVKEINDAPIKTVGMSTVTVGDIGRAEDAYQIQANVVRVNGQPSVYLPIMKQGGDTNTIAVVDGIKDTLSRLGNIPKELVTNVVFDQSLFVKRAIETLLREGAIGLVLTALMVLVFLASFRATIAVFLSIPLSALAAFIALYFGGGSINTMILAGLALVFSRLIDNAVIVLENIFRHLEMGEPPAVAAETGGEEVAMAVLAATLTSSVVFFPVMFLYGVSRFLFSALALAVVLSLFASYFVALTVVPLFCAKLIKAHHGRGDDAHARLGERFTAAFNHGFTGLLETYESRIRLALRRPGLVIVSISAVFVVSLLLYPLLGVAFFPRTDAGQFVINLKSPSGTRIEVTTQDVARVEALVRHIVDPTDLDLITSNIGVTPDISAIYTSNAGPHTATVQVALVENHKIGSYEYMDRVRRAIRAELPQLTAYFQSGGMVDAVLNQGLPAPIDLQVSSPNLDTAFATASDLARGVRSLAGVSDVYIPQDLDYPSLRLDINRERANELGLNQREVVSNVITALTSNGMIAPSYWVDPKSGNDYMLTVQYPENRIRSVLDLKNIPLHSSGWKDPTLLDAVSRITPFRSPTEVDHYQIQRVIDIYVNPATEDLGRVASGVRRVMADTQMPAGVRVAMRGMVEGMQASFTSFGAGLILALVLLYLILVAQFRSFVDPVLILLAVPTGLTGVLLALFLTGTTLNVQSLMGVLMMVGMVVSNSILIVEFTHRLEEDGMPLIDAVVNSCRIRLRPILMTSLATIIGLTPMALKLGTGSEAYAPLARAIIGGLLVSVVLTVFIVPAAYLLVYRRRPAAARGEAQ